MENFIDVSNKIDNEGLGYFILDYTSSDSMPDQKSKELFEAAEDALSEFRNYIEEKAQEEE